MQYENLSLKLLMRFDLAFQMECECSLLEVTYFFLQTVSRKLLTWMGHLFPNALHQKRYHLSSHIYKSQILTLPLQQT